MGWAGSALRRDNVRRACLQRQLLSASQALQKGEHPSPTLDSETGQWGIPSQKNDAGQEAENEGERDLAVEGWRTQGEQRISNAALQLELLEKGQPLL